MESQGKVEKSQGKVREKSGNSVSKIWQTPCTLRTFKEIDIMFAFVTVTVMEYFFQTLFYLKIRKVDVSCISFQHLLVMLLMHGLLHLVLLYCLA